MFGGLNMDHISPWRFRLVDQQPASGLLDLGILVPSSAILPLAMLEPKYSMVPRLLCSLRALRAMRVVIVHFQSRVFIGALLE